MNLSSTVREYIDSLVHPSARHDALAVAWHRGFIASRLAAGLLGLTALPLYMLVCGSLGPIELIIFCWFLVPIALAHFLSRTGRYETAHILSAMALAALVTMIAAQTGGLSSPVVVWLLLIPAEAALCASRRVVAVAAAVALAAAALCVLLPGGGAANGAAALLSVAAALLYVTALAHRAGSLARTGRNLLQEEENRYRLLALNMTDVISRHAPNGAVLFVSPAAAGILGTATQDLLGQGLFDRVHVADRPAYLRTLSQAAVAAAPGSVEFRVRREAALGAPHFVWLEMRCRAAESDDGAIREIVAVMRDVTSRKEQEKAVEHARSEAEHANAAKARFLATMSHELRTPLNAVIGFSEMLMHETALNIDAERRLDYARLIHDSGQHLLSVVNLVLDMSKIESGNFVITPEPFAPAAVIRNCCDLLTLKAREAGIDIFVRVPPDLPEIVADKRALKQMLLNLLSNAVKFTTSGGQVVIAAAAEPMQISITVEDTGVGISAADLRQVGVPFFQARGSYDRPYEGTGLGLSIVKGLVELHGGELQVASELGRGTQVTIRLPIDCEKHRPQGRGAVVPLGSRAASPANGESTKTHWSEVKKSA